MKKILFLMVLVIAGACKQSGTDEGVSKQIAQLHKLANDADYFNLYESFEAHKNIVPKTDSLYFEGILAAAFNQTEASNKAIEAFFAFHKIQYKDSLAIKLLETKLINEINLFEYKNALQTNDTLQKLYEPQFAFDKLDDLKNTYALLKSLENTPKQEFEIAEDAEFPIKKDKAGLSNLEVAFGDKKVDFVFDTGANFSVIQKSVAEAMGLQIIKSKFMVNTASGRKVNSDLALAERLEIGPITLRNVVFLIFEDEDLTFPPIDYEMKGILGFPITRAFEEIRISKESLFIPKDPTDYKLRNLAFDGLIPVVKVDYKADALPFHFNPGAQTTSLYSKFYERYKTEIEAKYSKTNLSLGGPQGQSIIEGYVLDSVDFSVGDSNAQLKNIKLFPVKIGSTDVQFGNLGQDYIQQFGTMIISFKSASILFR